MRGFLVVTALLCILACTSHKTETKADPCLNRCGMVDGLVCAQCGYGKTCNEQQYCVDLDYPDQTIVNEEPDESEDAGINDISDEHDYDYLDLERTSDDEPCPDLTKAKIPYYDIDGTIHFCRQCDKIRADDTQCVRNLWKDANERLVHDMPAYDCLDYPCEMKKLKPIFKGEKYTGMDVCDMIVNPIQPGTWDSGISTFKNYNFGNGKVGLVLSNMDISATEYHNDARLFEFDIVKRSYTVVGATPGANLTYNNGAFFTYYNVDFATKDKRYVYYVDSGRNYHAVYNRPIDFIVYQPIMNEKWVVMTMQEVGSDPETLKYAKIGEWKWKSLFNGIGYLPYLLGDRLYVYTDQFKGYVCDLDKEPKDLEVDCILVNQEGEKIRKPIPDRMNPNLVYYSPVGMTDGIMRVNIEKTPYSYERVSLQTNDNTKSVNVYQVEGNTILYGVVYMIDIAMPDRWDQKQCYHRLDKLKSYCSLPTAHDFSDGVEMLYNQGSSEFEGHYLVYQNYNWETIHVRDMECYCDYHPELCPFDDYTPQPDNPKDVKTNTRPKPVKKAKR